MKRVKFLSALFALTLPFLLSLACGIGGPPAIGDVVMLASTDDNAPVTTTYQPENTFVVSVQANNVVAGSTIKVVYQREGALYDEGTTATIDEDGSTTWNFSLEPGTAGHMPGGYTVEVYLDNTLAKTVSFTVAGDPTPRIAEVVTASVVDEELNPIVPTANFKPFDTVNVLVSYKNVISGTLKTVLYFDGEVAAEREEPIGQITGAGTFNWILSSDSGFSAGTYTIEVFLDGEPYSGNPVTFTVSE